MRVGVEIKSPRAKVSFKIAKASRQTCVKRGSGLRTLKAGTCVVTFTVQEPKPKGAERPKAKKTTKTLVVNKSYWPQ
jgi:hypothetical protein